MKPEDMLVEEQETEQPEQAELEDEQIEELLSQVTFSLEDYQTLYSELSKLVEDVNRAIVTVTGVTSDVDWFDNIYENMASASGVIVANNGKSILVLVSESALSGADNIVVTFCDQTQAEAEIVQRDETLGLAILSIPLLSLDEDTMDVIDIATLGSSNANNLLGTPVVALGSPLGTSGSSCYGVITSTGTTIDQVDSAYKLITTDIYGSRSATGVLVNLKGMVIGIIGGDSTGSDMPNLLTAYGISELKKTIEKMSNDQDRAYLGIHGTDVPPEAILEYDIPAGAYIKEIEMDSPAMTAGIQSGDVITKVNGMPITVYNELLNVLYNTSPGDDMTLTLVRQGREMNVEVTLGER
jgi:serine protease Do